MNASILIRPSTSSDLAAIRRLAALDDRRPPRGEALLAFLEDDLRAALPLDGGRPVADPFHRTDELVELLRLRANWGTA